MLAALLAVTSGCATYSDRLQGAHASAAIGDWPGAVSTLSTALGATTPDELPSRLRGDRPLLALDRGVVQQTMGRFEASSRDLAAAEQELEILDLSTNPVAVLGSYLYSDSARTYRIPPTERLALNPVNLLNHLARGDLQGAAVEARRFQVMREFMDTIGARAAAPDRFGAYLAGFVFEKSGEGDRALRYYDEALGGGRLQSLATPVARLAQRHSWRGTNLAAFLEETRTAASNAPTASGDTAGSGEILVVVAMGRVPHRVPERIPVGAAVGLAGVYLGDRDLDILKYSATKVLAYPELVATPSGLGQPSLLVDGRRLELEALADLGSAIHAEYLTIKPKLLAAALTRMATRAALSEGARAAGREDSQALGDVLAIVLEAALVAADRPDTRSWTMLPDRVLVARVPVLAGVRSVEVAFAGSANANRRVTVEVPAGGWAAVVVTEPR